LAGAVPVETGMARLIQILEILVADVEAGWPAALCAVLEKHGSAPQTPGATMLVRSDGSTVGTVGGGAAEAEVGRQALRLLEENRSALLKLKLDANYGWDDTPICGGSMTVGIMPVTRGAEFAAFRTAFENVRDRRPAYIPIIVEHEGKRREYRLNVEVPPTLLIAGAGHVGQAVARLAVDLDFHVVVIDDRGDMAAPERFPAGVELKVGDIAATLRDYSLDAGCYVVVVTRGHKHDHAALEAVIGREAAYVGMIASQRKAATLLSKLAEAGVPKGLIDAVHTPIGVPIGAQTVNEIAVSIMAELIQVRRQSTPALVEGPIERSTGEE
jgi:xanthine dehydrogenase accessory factor